MFYVIVITTYFTNINGKECTLPRYAKTVESYDENGDIEAFDNIWANGLYDAIWFRTIEDAKRWYDDARKNLVKSANIQADSVVSFDLNTIRIQHIIAKDVEILNPYEKEN